MKKFRKILLSAMIVCISVYASGILAFAQSDITCISGNDYYDADEGCFLYIVPELNDREIRSNVANGMITSGPVWISLEDYDDVELYCDGELISDPDFSSIKDDGSYTLNIVGTGIEFQPLSFRIVPDLTGVISEYAMPDGFSVEGVKLNGEEIAVNTRAVDLTAEGDYSIDYICTVSGERYNLELEIDHTPPVLALENVVNGVAKGPVSVADAESGSAMVVIHEGKQMKVGMNNLLDESGDYHITITDTAGNTTEYVFRITVYFSLVTILAFLLLAAIIAVLLIFLMREKKKMRVR